MGCLCSQEDINDDFARFPKVTGSSIVDGKHVFGTNVPAAPLLKEVNFAVISDSDPDDVDLDDDEINNILEEDSDE